MGAPTTGTAGPPAAQLPGHSHTAWRNIFISSGCAAVQWAKACGGIAVTLAHLPLYHPLIVIRLQLADGLDGVLLACFDACGLRCDDTLRAYQVFMLMLLMMQASLLACVSAAC